ncbi:Probable ABC transporter permease protein YtcP [Geodia barretti]|uniref:Probable ABC transporter permease protein YtcP n=1 Tax=Geodia barretti TaxID=519541 RepID=A0AA35WGN3_GEOBA|nr:Probable ABC transporter permease protein YtcP [Geodia barretti]
MANPLVRVTPLGRAFDIANYLFLGLFALSILYPFWTVITTSLASPASLPGRGLHLWNEEWRTEAWAFMFRENAVGTAYLNTLHRVVFGTTLTLFVTFCAAYALSKRNLPGRGVITFLLVFTLFFQGGIIPTYLLVRNLGMINSRWVLVVIPAIAAFNIIITRNFIMTIDQAMEDSAVIDGASYWRIMFSIFIPLVEAGAGRHRAVDGGKPLERVLLLRDIVQRLQGFQTDDSMQRLIEELRAQGIEPDWARIPHRSIQAATTLITIGPVVLFYPFVQKYFVKGVMLGSVKG